MSLEALVSTPSLCQIAICTADAAASMGFYAALLGLYASGSFAVRGTTAARLLELERVSAVNHWMAGGGEFFQLELFEFSEPRPSSQAATERTGYERIFVEVGDIEATLRQLKSSGACTLATDLERPTVVRDPDGVLIELVAGDTRLRHGKVVGVSLVVDDLPDALRYFRQALGLPLSSTQREENAFGSVRSFRFDAGAHWIELLHRPGAAGVRPLNERGLMNIALGVRRPRDFRAIYQRVLNNGFTSSTPPIGGALSNVVYLRSRQGVSVELLQLPAWMDAIWGFRAPGALARLVRSAISWLVGGRTGQTRR